MSARAAAADETCDVSTVQETQQKPHQGTQTGTVMPRRFESKVGIITGAALPIDGGFTAR